MHHCKIASGSDQTWTNILFNTCTPEHVHIRPKTHSFRNHDHLHEREREIVRLIFDFIWSHCLFRIRYDGRYRQSRDTILVTSTKEAQALVHVLQFIPRIATQSDLACRTVLEAGILDMLLRVYVLFPSFSRSSIDAPEHWPPLLQACRSTLLALSQSEINHDAVLEHSVCALWADCHPHPPPYSVEPPSIKDSIPARQAGWRRANRRCVKRRIMAVIIDSQWRSNVYEIEDIEVCTDIVEFTQ